MVQQNAVYTATIMKKVLVIDDVKEIVMLMVETLQVYGFNTVEALDGASALLVAQEQRPDLVLCDMHMPNLDGFGVLAALRQNESTASVPFIFVSGDAGTAKRQQAKELGATDFIAKPFTASELMSTVGNGLKEKV